MPSWGRNAGFGSVILRRVGPRGDLAYLNRIRRVVSRVVDPLELRTVTE